MNRLGNNILAWLALTVVFAIMGAGAALGLLSYGNVTAQELSASAADKKTELLAGLSNGQILYWKMEEYKRDRHGSWESGVPDGFVTENWMTQQDDGSLEESVSISRYDTGAVVRYGTYKGGRAVTTYVAADEEIVINVTAHGSIETWFDGLWGRVDAGFERQGESASRVTVDGEEKALFEWDYGHDEERPDLGYKKRRIEIIVDDPLLRRYMTYKVDESGAETLIGVQAITEYALLPVGSAMPTAP